MYLDNGKQYIFGQRDILSDIGTFSGQGDIFGHPDIMIVGSILAVKRL